ncbi:S-layer homology domain-containing protein [Marinicrinis lubricantis]|uniref:S-layer homology domain-containing protein n=1 Tax=Marinicrinis lubricantis TaxID=2086470 RepID=A0ABW1ILD3_9BACL
MKKWFTALWSFIVCVSLVTPSIGASGTSSSAAVLSSSSKALKVGESVTVNVVIEQVTDLYGIQFEVVYDPQKLKIVQRSISSSYNDVLKNADPAADLERTLFPLTRSSLSDTAFKEQIKLASFTFEALEAGSAVIELRQLKAVSTEKYVNTYGRNDLKVIPIVNAAPLRLQITPSNDQGGQPGNPGHPGNPGRPGNPGNPGNPGGVSEELVDMLEQLLSEHDPQKALQTLLEWLESRSDSLSAVEKQSVSEAAHQLIGKLLHMNSHLSSLDSSSYLLLEETTFQNLIQMYKQWLAAANDKELDFDRTIPFSISIERGGNLPLRMSAQMIETLSELQLDVQVRAHGAIVTFPIDSFTDKPSDVVIRIASQSGSESLEGTVRYRPAAIYQFEAGWDDEGTLEWIDSFTDGVTVEVQYEEGSLDTEKLGFYYFNEKTGRWEYMKQAKHDPANWIFTVKLDHFSQYAVLERTQSFTDLSSTYAQAQRAIDVLTAQHILSGVDESYFAPNRALTRAEFTAVLARVFDWEATAHSGVFTDVKESQWFAGAVEAAYREGAAQGYAGQFHPNELVSREQMVSMLIRAAGVSEQIDSEAAQRFVDDQFISSWAREDVYVARSLGWVKGDGTNRLDPLASSTRADMAVFIYQFMSSRLLNQE